MENEKDKALEKREKIIFYFNKSNKDNQSLKFNDLIKKIKPGDIFVYSGHTMLVYDVVKDKSDNIVDVLLLHAWQRPYIKSSLGDTYRLSYNNFEPSGITNSKGETKITDNLSAGKNLIEGLAIQNEGTIKQTLLSKFKESFEIKNGKIQCQKAECAIIRPFSKDKNNNASFILGTKSKNCEKTKLRMEYPNLKIEKTSSVGDKNSIIPGTEIEYTIKITNNSSSPYKEKFYVEETLDSKVELDTTTIYRNKERNGTYFEDKNTIRWSVSKLGSGVTATFKYKVKVKEKDNNISTTGTTTGTTGKFYKQSDNTIFIATGTIENKIVENHKNDITNNFEKCYNKHKNGENNARKKFTGLALIAATYNCATNDSTYKEIYNDFKNFTFDGLIRKSDESNISLNSSNIYSKIILNNYWNAITYDSENGIYKLPHWTKCNENCEYHQGSRAKTIYSNDFKTGDILIYKVEKSKKSDYVSFENGIYAYIYINGEFIGVNGKDKTERNKFSQTYYSAENWENKKEKLSIDALYENDFWISTSLTKEEKKFINYQSLFAKDYYVILRPSLISKDEWSELLITK